MPVITAFNQCCSFGLLFAWFIMRLTFLLRRDHGNAIIPNGTLHGFAQNRESVFSSRYRLGLERVQLKGIAYRQVFACRSENRINA